MAGTSNAYSKGALVFKADTGAGVPSDQAPGVYQSLNYAAEDYWYERVGTSIGGFNSAVLNAAGGSALLRLTRTGNVFRTYRWNGTAWVQHGGDRTIAMSSAGYLGIAAASGNAGTVTVLFSNVSVNGVSP
jgi:hypothetical protein